MANVFNLLKEALKDNEPNDQIEATLNKMLNNETEYFLSEYSMNLDFMLLMVENAVDIRSSNVNENELRLRAKLMNKFMIRDCFQYYLHLLTNIINLCRRRNLTLAKINTVMQILQQESVITPFVYSHWHSAFNHSDNLRDQDVIQQRFCAINMCIAFLNKMEDPQEA